jgi:hypothetical protein
MISAQLIDTLNKLPPDLQVEILHYAEDLATNHSESSPADAPPQKYRQAGTMNGLFTMVTDFDALLDNLKDYRWPCLDG